MAAKVLKMESGTKTKKAPSREFSHYAEDSHAQYLLTGTDAHGKTEYFFKLNMTGLRDRVFGPYDSRSAAVDGFDTVLMGALEAFCEVLNTGRGNESKSNNGLEHIALPQNLTPVPMR
jgi:hypothetical protein